jgi:hypothetical protein
MKYQLDFSAKISTASPPVTGAIVASTGSLLFAAWQPSTWPAASASAPGEFIEVLKRIFEESILGEVRNVIDDITRSNGTHTDGGRDGSLQERQLLSHRGSGWQAF